MRIDSRFEGGKGQGTRGNGRRRTAVASRGEERGRLEVGAILTGGPQLAAREKSGEEEVGRAGFVGRKRRWASGEKKEREESCWAGPRGEGERFRGLESFVFFQNFSNLFKL
jgi:hypothetical protein